MARYKANEVTWEKVKVLNKECLFNDLRITRDSIPEGYTMYEVRHSDDDWGEPCEIDFGILVNFFGTLLTKEPFEELLETDVYIEESTDWFYLDEYVQF